MVLCRSNSDILKKIVNDMTVPLNPSFWSNFASKLTHNLRRACACRHNLKKSKYENRNECLTTANCTFKGCYPKGGKWNIRQKLSIKRCLRGIIEGSIALVHNCISNHLGHGTPRHKHFPMLLIGISISFSLRD